MARIKCTYTTPPGDKHCAGQTRYVDVLTGKVYDLAGSSQQCNSGYWLDSSGVFVGYPGVLTPVESLIPVTSKEVPLTDSKCPIRSKFTDSVITQAYRTHGVKGGAEYLSNLAPQFTEVSRQLFRFWCIDLGIHVPKSKRATQVQPKRTA